MEVRNPLRLLWLFRPQIARVAIILALIRLLANLPLPGRPADLAALFHGDGFLALFDVFTGGAAARYSVAALGFYPYLLARLLTPLARIVLGRISWELRMSLDDVYKENLALLTRLLTGLTAAALGGGYLFLLQRLAPDLKVDFLSGIASVASLSAGSMFLLWLVNNDEEETTYSNLNVVLALNAAAAVPGYLFAGPVNWPATALWCGLILIAAYGYAILSNARRNVPVMFGRRPIPRAKPATSTLPLLVTPGLAPVFILLIVLGGAHFSAPFFLQAQSGWIRQLAGLERDLTDTAAPPFWLIVLGPGALLQVAYGRARLGAQNLARQLQVTGGFIPGLRPGAATDRYLDRIVMRLAPASALLGMLLITAPASAGLASGVAGPQLMMVFPALYALGPIQDFWSSLHAAGLLRNYSEDRLIR